MNLKKYIKKVVIIMIIMIIMSSQTEASYGEEKEYITENAYEFETIKGDSYWVGWREYHYGYKPKATTYKTEEVEYKYKEIKDGILSEKTTTYIAKGYGLYNMDYSKHMVGFLNYAKENYSKEKEVEFRDERESEESEERKKIPIKEAIEKVMEKVITSWYAKEYEEGTEYLENFKADGFRRFWKNCMTDEEEIKKIQNEYFVKVYASEAINKLDSLIRKFEDEYKPAIRGVVFSIMEARYRNKNLQGKKDLKLKVKEKELWPFYVYCEKDEAGKIEWPDKDLVIDGVYQWMYYYENKFQTTTYNTVTTHVGNKEEEIIEIDWITEYERLTNKEFPYLEGNELQYFYDRITNTRTKFTESGENAEGIFGAEEIYENKSEFSFSKAMANMQEAMYEMSKGSGLSNIWQGLTAENMARTYMLAKNIVENERIQNEYANYNIGTNIMTYSPGKQDKIIILKDFQKIELKQSINEEGDVDTDEDGLYDKEELSTYMKVDVTGFVEKMVIAELYGKNKVSEEEKEAVMKKFIENVKIRAPEKRNNNSAECYLREENEKLIVDLFDYTSNPVIKDTDFDGLTDYEEERLYGKKSEKLINNKIEYKMVSDYGVIENTNVNMDYRYFFMNNKNYYDELSTVSVMLCNEIEGNEKQLQEILKKIGMLKNSEFKIKEVEVDKNTKVKYIAVTNEVEYTHNAEEIPIRKKIKLIVIKSIEENLNTTEDVGISTNNHETFDKLAQVIYDNEYGKEKSEENGEDYVYWITGYREGGAIANILSAKIIDRKKNKKEIYCYTYGAPNTVYNNSDSVNGIINAIESKYCCIFNVVNSEDVYAFIPTRDIGWTKYGVTAIKSGEKALNSVKKEKWFRQEYTGGERVPIIIEEAIDDMFAYLKNKSRTEYYKNINGIEGDTIYRAFKDLLTEYRKGEIKSIKNDLRNHYNQRYFTKKRELREKLIKLIDIVNMYRYEIGISNDMAVYYAISKSITPQDIKFVVQRVERKEGYDDSQEKRYQEILMNEFNFHPYRNDPKRKEEEKNNQILKYLTDLYKNIKVENGSTFGSIKEYFKVTASCVYNDTKWFLMGLYNGKENVKYKIANYFLSYDGKESIAAHVYDSIDQQYRLASSQDSPENKNDFAHMGATISVYMKHGANGSFFDLFAKWETGIDDAVACAGYIGDLCGIYDTPPSLKEDDYRADLDAVNLYYRFSDNEDNVEKKSYYEIFNGYYYDIYENTNDEKTTRASEFLKRIPENKIQDYREDYEKHIKKKYKGKNKTATLSEIENRLNYFDNFIENLRNNNNSLVKYEEYPYSEYE